MIEPPKSPEPAKRATEDAPVSEPVERPDAPKPDPEGRGSGWHAVGAALLAFGLVFLFASDLCAVNQSPLVGHPALSFTSTIVGGEDEGDRIVLDGLRGHVVVLDFWASWCPPCRASIPALDEFARRHPDVVVLGVNTEHERPASFVRSAHASLGASYPTVHDSDGRIQAAYRITGLPTILVIDAEGEVHDANVGGIDLAWLEQHVPTD